MAKKQITDQELLASQANAEFVNRNTEETVIESEADSLSLEEIKSNSIIHNSNDFDWDMDNKKLGGYSDAERAKLIPKNDYNAVGNEYSSVNRDAVADGDSMGRGTGTFLDVYNVNAGTSDDVMERKNEIKINKFNSSKTYPNF